MSYDLVIIGGTASGLSVAISSLRSGLGLVRIVEAHSAVAFPELVGDNQLDIGFGEDVKSVDADEHGLIVTTNRLAYRTRAVLVANRSRDDAWVPPIAIPSTLGTRVHVDECNAGTDEDVFVVGYTDHAVELTATMAAAGARVVLAAGGHGSDPTVSGRRAHAATSRARAPGHVAVPVGTRTDRQRRRLSRWPYFDDRHTPDLQFDHVSSPPGDGCCRRPRPG